jgi:hypothetical protein
MEASVERKVKLAKFVLDVQKRLVLDNGDEKAMEQAILSLRPEDYDMVLEERSFEGICAFPLCNELVHKKNVSFLYFIDSNHSSPTKSIESREKTRQYT